LSVTLFYVTDIEDSLSPHDSWWCAVSGSMAGEFLQQYGWLHRGTHLRSWIGASEL
jgi:hypothetical protein